MHTTRNEYRWGQVPFIFTFLATLGFALMLTACGTSESPQTGGMVPQQDTARPASPTAQDTHPAAEAAGCALEGMPLAFEENQGQFDERALFAARHATGTFFFTADSLAAVFSRSVKVSTASTDPADPAPKTETRSESFALKITFVGAAEDVLLEGEERQQGKVSYFRGNDPEKWVSGAPTFTRLVYRDLWPGIDLAWSGAAGRLNAEYRLARAGDAKRIRLRYEGQDGLSIGDDGRLVIATPWGELHEEAPTAEQNGRPVEIAFILDPDTGELGVRLDGADPDAPLTINP